MPAIADASGPVIVVGHSLGGPIAARFVMDHPDKVAALILVAGSIDPAQEKILWYQGPASWAGLRWMLPSALDVCNRELMPLKGELTLMLPLWSQIKVPVELIQGTDDHLVPAANADFGERMIDPKILHVTRVPGMDHFVPWSNPELIRDAILRHLPPEPSQGTAKP
jgi:pimeloyl-ACP methyl ester carboxylesterase